MKKQTVLLTAALVFGCLATNAMAQQNEAPSKFYAGAELGSSALKDRSGELATTLVAQVGGAASATQDSSVGIGRIFGGLNVNENIGLELGYNQTSSFGFRFTGVSGGAVAYAGSASAKVSGLDYSVLLRPSVSTGLNGLFFKVGGHSLEEKVDVAVNAGSVSVASSKTYSGSGMLYGIGYDARLSNTLDMRIAYTYADKIAGSSGDGANIFSIGLVAKF